VTIATNLLVISDSWTNAKNMPATFSLVCLFVNRLHAITIYDSYLNAIVVIS
jgi:hypothetical protein